MSAYIPTESAPDIVITPFDKLLATLSATDEVPLFLINTPLASFPSIVIFPLLFIVAFPSLADPNSLPITVPAESSLYASPKIPIEFLPPTLITSDPFTA